MNNVFVFTNTLQLGGAEKQSILLAHVLSKYYETTLIVYYGKETDKSLLRLIEEYDFKYILLKSSHFRKIWTIIKKFKTKKPQIIFSYLATTNLINALIGTLTGVNYKVGGFRSTETSKWKLKIQKLLHNKLLSASVCNSFTGSQFLANSGFTPEKLHVIHNYIDIKENLFRRHRNEEIINILSVGRFVAEKDYSTALSTIKIVKQSLSEDAIRFSYTIVGYGQLEQEIRDEIEHLNLSDEVNLVINPTDIKAFYRNSDLYFSSSKIEGLSNSIMESMEYSLPVIATDVGDSKYLVIEGETGFLAKAGDSKGLASRIKQLILSNESRIKMGQNGYNHIKTNFSEHSFSSKYFKLINSLSGE